MAQEPRVLESQTEWRSDDVADPAAWMEVFSAPEREELDAALRQVLAEGRGPLEIGQEEFALPGLTARLAKIEQGLIDGLGFVVLRGLPRDAYSQEEMELLYWGIGMHLGSPWPQNQRGHVLGDVLDQGKSATDPTSRGNELGGALDFPYHSDGSDLVGLLCLQKARTGGASAVANAVTIHNDLVREAPELAAALYEPQPYDYRGEQGPDSRPYYEMPVFTDWKGRLFVRYIRPYILASQRHEGVPRITPLAEQAMQRLDAMTLDPAYNATMTLEPGDMLFVNNYHVLHARKAYVDDPEAGVVRHLKRLWLETRVLEDRPPYFRNNPASHWAEKRSVSRLAPN
ncbi:MAG: taurine catabolism dioxygenase TauD [Deltaproteobacteria bacterium]|jgi:alpha-ketoglutarate-dependent taurine dioxygenase|nr:taurine catabolism dioxygenase TauD [Deltaproteobacteria bacterium]